MEDNSVVEFQDFPNGQMACILKAGISLVNGYLNWRCSNSISWKTQWNMFKTLDEGILFNDLYCVNML